MSNSDNCCEAEFLASWRKFMAENPQWELERAPNIFSKGFYEGMKYAQAQASRIRETPSSSSSDDLHLRTGGPIRTRLGEIKGPPVNVILREVFDFPSDERKIWYVHVNECGGVWGLVGGGPLTRADADALVDDLKERGIAAGASLDWERSGL